ncbi:nitroreductase family protein [Candidatus Bipolaricaulota bacterium]|nr:nitroreductase family protein [Candidatus Bipolaricaulota bacterium]
MLDNNLLETVRERKMIFKFKDKPVEEEKLNAVLQAGYWSESFGDCEPWQFVVVEDPELKQELYELTKRVTIYTAGIKNAPITIAIAITGCGTSHFIEEGAVTAHNMALAAHSLGLGSYWLDVYDLEEKKDSVEAEAKRMLGFPDDVRLAYMLPLGYPDQRREETRAKFDDVVHYNRYGNE